MSCFKKACRDPTSKAQVKHQQYLRYKEKRGRFEAFIRATDTLPQEHLLTSDDEDADDNYCDDEDAGKDDHYCDDEDAGEDDHQLDEHAGEADHQLKDEHRYVKEVQSFPNPTRLG